MYSIHRTESTSLMQAMRYRTYIQSHAVGTGLFPSILSCMRGSWQFQKDQRKEPPTSLWLTLISNTASSQAHLFSLILDLPAIWQMSVTIPASQAARHARQPSLVRLCPTCDDRPLSSKFDNQSSLGLGPAFKACMQHPPGTQARRLGRQFAC